eukprot:5218566-Pleurochrysis_carterae.AAC.1
MFGLVREDSPWPQRASLTASARTALLDALILPVKTLDACTSPFLVATAHQAAVAVAPFGARHSVRESRVVKGGCALWVTLAMLAGTPYHLPASLAAFKLRSYMTPGVHDPPLAGDAQHWTMEARELRSLLAPTFPLALAPDDSMADALLRCERANARLRAALSVPASDPDHDYLRSWADRVGACDLGDLVHDDALLDSAAPERASPALSLHPFTLLSLPPRMEPVSPPRLQPVSCYSQTFDSPPELLTPTHPPLLPGPSRVAGHAF